jgi:hypothetical protein
MSVFTKIDNLREGNDYWVDVWWNLVNTYRSDIPFHFVGKFSHVEVVPAKRVSTQEGLVSVVVPRRTLVWFKVNGRDVGVSSMNRFYGFFKPPKREIFERYILRTIALPTDLTRYMRRFISDRYGN